MATLLTCVVELKSKMLINRLKQVELATPPLTRCICYDCVQQTAVLANVKCHGTLLTDMATD